MVILGETNHLQGFTVAMQYNLANDLMFGGDAFLIIQQIRWVKLVSIARFIEHGQQ
jgi:hypothetical protein